jgi:hypothetical protein
MTKRFLCQIYLVVLLFAASPAPPLRAQEAPSGQISTPSTESEKHEHVGYRLPEAEFVGSSSFRSASLIQPLWNALNFEGHYRI